MTRMSTIHTMRPRDLHKGELVLFRRKIAKGRGQKKEQAVWIGPGRVIAVESNKTSSDGSDDRFGHLIHVSYNGRLWGCTAEQLQPLHPSAKIARGAMEDDEEMKKFFKETETAKVTDIRMEAPLPGEDIELPPRDFHRSTEGLLVKERPSEPV